MTDQQSHDCDMLLGFCIMCRVSFEQFHEAVVERMPDKTPEEKQFLLEWAKAHFRIIA